MKKLCLLIAGLFFIFNMNLPAIIYCNQIPPITGEEAKSPDRISAGNVERAAHYYFLFKGEIDRYFADVEINGLNSGKDRLEIALKYLDLGLTWYSITKENVYLSDYQEKGYKNYDYSLFLNDPSFHKQTMEKVVRYFSKGDIKGFFGEIIDHLSKTRELVENMQGTVTKEELWLLYRLTADQFGHYGTLVSNAVFE